MFTSHFYATIKTETDLISVSWEKVNGNERGRSERGGEGERKKAMLRDKINESGTKQLFNLNLPTTRIRLR